ncbi:MAG: WD40/YVTN/BNR-like repeat-containing protein [Actinomycetota bacterium]
MARSPRTSSSGSTRSGRMRLGALLLALAALGGMRLLAASGGTLGGFNELLENSVTGPELEGPLSPAGEWLISQRANERGMVTASSYARALEQAESIRALTAKRAPELIDAPWTNLGPTNIGGRVVEVVVDSATNVCAAGSCVNDNVYAAAASGGVWKSGNAGETWSYAWPPGITQSMGALAIGENGVLYAGTGEANPGGGSIVWGGTGIYRSSDGANTWQHVGLPDSGAFGRIAVDPKNPQRVFAAAAGNLFVPGGQRGLYRSTDGGDTWQRVLAGENDTTGAIDVSIDPVNPSNILVAMWDHVRLPTHRMYGGVGSGVYLSKDGGDTWQEATLPGNVAPEQVGRIGVTFAPSDPSRAYAIVASKLDGSGVGLWRSNDGGVTWAKTSASVGSLSQSTYGWWFGKVWVDPADAQRVFVAGLELVESTNGGDSFTAHGVSTAGVLVAQAHHLMPHADQHGMAWDPSVPGRVYVANDGGVYRSDANGRIGTWHNAVSQGWTQHYSVDVNELAPDQIITGLQDNMCRRSVPASQGAAPTWTQIGICGDGLQTLINPVDPTWTYTCSQYGACGVQRGGVPDPRRPGQLVGAKPPGQRYGWMTPLEFDPSDPNVMYFGSNVLSRSTNNGINFTAISPDLTTDAEQLDPNEGYRIFSTITAVAVAKSNASVIYVGTDDGLVWRTSDLGANWTMLTDLDEDGDGPDQAGTNGLPNEWVTRIAVDPADASLVYATFSEFRKGSNAARVVKSTDGGQTWNSISGNLPAAPVNEIVTLPGGKLAVGTDVGAFMSSDVGVTWLTVGSNMPAVPILDLRYHQATNTLTAATFGHGVQRVILP